MLECSTSSLGEEERDSAVGTGGQGVGTSCSGLEDREGRTA